MKKTTVLLAALCIGMSGFAQKAKIYTATEYLRDGDMKRAITAIDEAVASESTKDDGDAWFTRGEIYEKLAEKEPTNLQAANESVRSYLKVLEVKPKYEKDKIDPKLLRVAYKAYNNGAESYGGAQPDYEKSFNQFKTVVDIREVNNGTHFATNKKFDTIAALALKYQALSAFYNKKTDLALTTLTKAKNNPISSDAYVYTTLIDLYTDQQKDAEVEKTLEEAKAKYPKNAGIMAQEMNFYSRTGKTDLLISKMEEAAKKDPDNPLLQYNLGVLYGSMANPKDAPKPANAKDYEAKAEMAYKMAIDADPTKADYVYNLGAMYFNNAADLTRQMNDVKGTTAEDNKKYDALKAKRTAEFTKALPYFQKSYDLLNPKADAKMEEEDVTTYRGTLVALQTIYEVMGQGEKGDEIQKKIEAFNTRK